MGGQRHTSATLPPGKSRYPLCRRLGGPQGRSGRVRKISPPPGFDPSTVQPVASRYTDWAIPALRRFSITNEINLWTEKGYRVMCLVYALYGGTNNCGGCENGDTHYAARECGKRRSLHLMSRGGVIRTRLRSDRDHYVLEFNSSLNCKQCGWNVRTAVWKPGHLLCREMRVRVSEPRCPCS